MMFQFSFVFIVLEIVDMFCVVVGVYEGGVFFSVVVCIDSVVDGVIKWQVESGDIIGKGGSVSMLFVFVGIVVKCVLVMGLGQQKGFDVVCYQCVNVDVVWVLGWLLIDGVVFYFIEIDVFGCDVVWCVCIVVLVVDYVSYCYIVIFKLCEKNVQLEFVCMGFVVGVEVQIGLDQGVVIVEGVCFVCELVNLLLNICNFVYIVGQVQVFVDVYSDQVSCCVLDEVEMEKFGFGLLFVVGCGLVNKLCLIVLEYKGGVEGDVLYVFVGKGVIFDFGGISFKFGLGMEEMKFDMGGVVGVFGVFVVVVKMGVKINLVCVVLSVENMFDGESYCFSDVFISFLGLIIEVFNIDVEGCLIFCDVLIWIVQIYKLYIIIDVVMFIGVCVIVLGKYVIGLMSKYDDFVVELFVVGEIMFDCVWCLLLWDDYQIQFELGFVDVVNIGGKSVGVIIVGCFLLCFIEGQCWVYLDIVGIVWDEGCKGLVIGCLVLLLVQWLLDCVNV